MSNLSLSLQITAVGMGIVFGAILILWLTMVLLTALTADKKSAPHKGAMSDSPEADSAQEAEALAQAAVVGVAMAIAEQQLSSAHPLKDPPTTIISAWQLGMRTRQMTQKGNNRPQRS